MSPLRGRFHVLQEWVLWRLWKNHDWTMVTVSSIHESLVNFGCNLQRKPVGCLYGNGHSLGVERNHCVVLTISE